MTKLLQEAFTIVSMNFSQKEQERFAHLIIENIGRLREFLEEEFEERSFDRAAVETLKSPKIQNMLGRAAKKYKNQRDSSIKLQ
ncbi:Uncharacterized protein dnl_56350 [Desulfonema limicola]|uniref:Uncharacterized protein n=1 Tax=Desulfonema limicola TaxID=45656 RepID=A0A975BDG7_9BACT|nr:hypothetical protein [Desulfonema limicola]QTA83240.1 Uncharacterized protein dnl_56350 [Desulfonema limicola]